MQQLSRARKDGYRDLAITYVDIAELKPLGRPTRRHSPEQIDHLVSLLKAYGFVTPILVDHKKRVIDGWGVVTAAKKLGLSKIPVVCNRDLSDVELRALKIALNKISELSSWDDAELKLEIQEILEIRQDLPLAIDVPTLDIILDGTGFEEEDDRPVMEEQIVAHCSLGAQYTCGKHLIRCDDAQNASSYRKLLGKDRASMIFTDPPYNVPIEGHVTVSKSAPTHDFAMAKGELSSSDFQDFLETTLRHAANCSVDGAIHFVCMDWRHASELLAAAGAVYAKTLNLCVWNKTNAGMGSLYRSQHELIFVFKHGKARHINNVNLGRHGRNRTNVWTYVSQNALSGTSKGKLALHPTIKPVAMIADAIRDCSKPGDIILDPFGGAGTTMIAAEKTGRCARLLELNPVYVDVAIQRWQRLTGQTAYHAETGRPYGDDKPTSSSK
ncbi:DNA methyltransferase [Bradyrhizobium sp. JYMT SZCCT0428]|uniref:site-specific DNA-methyltransferase n=1 Tax=Bradyrhizobium sp. JYMT SZCCT0428 TaxID=2807673 RepID=UPI001BA4ECA9|nr:DNA methyltransferase [Bradyrhizobium sp. JYMT SZCCT0428]MBR1156000.1 ParB N-terminal domain-containing protein [Bradyrhizobium sp. JYMT SZCCT0428]